MAVKQSGGFWAVAIAALMALAMVLAWAPVGREAGAPRVHAAVHAPVIQHALAAEDDRQAHGSMLHAECGISAMGCCGMGHCLSGIAVEPLETTGHAARDEARVAATVQASGSEPGLILPPPRRTRL